MMKIKRIVSCILVLVLIVSTFCACSAVTPEDADELIANVQNAVDGDDDTQMEIDSNENSTVEVTDNNGNILTIVPVYDCDGTTPIAGYIETAKDKNGNVLDSKAYPLLKSVIAVEINTDNDFLIRYDESKAPIVLDSESDEKTGYIIAIKDTIDIDGNKNVDEYFQCETIIDKKGNIFIKLSMDENKKRINVEVKTNEAGVTEVITADGKKKPAVNTNKAQNLKDVASQTAQNNAPSTTNQSSNGSTTTKPASNGGSGSSNTEPTTDKPQDTTPQPADPTVDYCTIVLGTGTKYVTDADNVEGKNNASGSYEVKVSGPGKYSKYVVSSEPGTTFTGKLEFQLHTTEEIEVKFVNVNISANAKTAVKFANLDRVVNKGSDSEGDVGSEGSDVGTAVDIPAPQVEVSFPEGTSSTIKANGSGNNGSIYSECKLGLKGYGSAVINGGQNLSGICCTESVKIKNVKLNIVSSAKQGISCDKKVTVESGEIHTETKGDGIHCNKFEMYGGNVDLNSLYTYECCDGIDSNDYVLIKGGVLNITALTGGKYSIKVRKILKSNPKGYFQIDGGTVTASGGQGQVQDVVGTQAAKSVFVTCTKPMQFTVGEYKSSAGASSFICSPTDATQATISNNQTKNLTAKYGFGGYYKFLVK